MSTKYCAGRFSNCCLNRVTRQIQQVKLAYKPTALSWRPHAS